MKRLALFAGIAAVTACSLLATAQPRKAAPKSAAKSEAGAPVGEKADMAVPRDGGVESSSGRAEGKGDGGSRVFRFGEVEVEGRLKSPQIVYFLRRVRAEFNAGDLGHRSFIRELDETKTESSF